MGFGVRSGASQGPERTEFTANMGGRRPLSGTARTPHDPGGAPAASAEDHAQNAPSLAALRGFVAAHPDVRVFVGHETDGVGTGVDDIAR